MLISDIGEKQPTSVTGDLPKGSDDNFDIEF